MVLACRGINVISEKPYINEKKYIESKGNMFRIKVCSLSKSTKIDVRSWSNKISLLPVLVAPPSKKLLIWSIITAHPNSP